MEVGVGYNHLSETAPSEAGRRTKHILRQIERITDAPPANTQIPDIAKHEATLDELLSYFPNHCLTWPGLAMVSTLTSYTYASNVINMARGSLKNSEKNQHAPTSNVRYYTRLASTHHLRVNDIPDYNEESLGRHLETFLWDVPSKFSDVLQPPWSLRSIGQGIENHPHGNFADRVKASLDGIDLPPNQSHPQSSTHRIVNVAMARRGNRDNVRDVLEEIRDKSNSQSEDYPAPTLILGENGEPLNIGRLEFVQKHHQRLKQQALLWVLKEMNSRQVARELKKARPDVVIDEKQYAAMLRKRKEKVLQRKPPKTGMQKSNTIKMTGKRRRSVLSGQKKKKNEQDYYEPLSAVRCPSITSDASGASTGIDTEFISLSPSITDLISSGQAIADEVGAFHLRGVQPVPDQVISSQLITGQKVLDQPFLGQPVSENANELMPGQAIDISNIHKDILAGTTIIRLPDMVRPGAILYDTPMVEDYEGYRSAEEVLDTIMGDG